MPHVEQMLTDLGHSAVAQVQAILDGAIYVGIGSMAVFAVIAILYLAADRAFAKVHVTKGTVLTKESLPGFVSRPVMFGFAGGFGSLAIPTVHRMRVRTPHGDIWFDVLKSTYENLSAGDDTLVMYRIGRYSESAKPCRVII